MGVVARRAWYSVQEMPAFVPAKTRNCGAKNLPNESPATASLAPTAGVQSPQAESEVITLQSRWMADGFLLATAIIWGVNIPVFKQAVGVLDQWVFNALRLTLATVTLGICAWIEFKFQPRRYLARLSRWRLIGFSLLAGLFYQLAFVLGMERTTAGNTALLLSSMPMWTAVLSYAFLAERLPKSTWVGLAVTFVGTLIVTTQSGSVSLSREYILGNLLILLAALTWASGTVLSRSLLTAMSPLQLAFWSNLLTTPVHLLIAMHNIPSQWGIAISMPTVLSILYSGIFSTGIAYATWHVGVRQLGGSHAAVYQNVVTLVAVLGGWIFLREQPMLAQVIGGVLIVAGLFIMRRSRL